MERISPAKIEKRFDKNISKSNLIHRILSEDKEEEDLSITDRLQQLERHILAIPSSNPALPTTVRL